MEGEMLHMKTIISDTCDVVFKRITDGKVIFSAEAQLASISQKIKEEKLKGGIGNRDIAVLRSDKEVGLKVRSAVFDSDWLEMVNGTSYASETNTIHKKEVGLQLVDNAGSLEVTFTGTPVTNGKIYVILPNGEQEDVTSTLLTKTVTVTLTNAKAGQTVTVLYEMEVTGNTLKLVTTEFPEKYMVEYHTIEYDIETNTVVNDLYWTFSSTTPKGDYEYSFENGKAISPEVEFTAMAPAGSDVIGKVIEVPRP